MSFVSGVFLSVSYPRNCVNFFIQLSVVSKIAVSNQSSVVVAAGRSLLQRRVLKQKIEIIGELNGSVSL